MTSSINLRTSTLNFNPERQHHRACPKSSRSEFRLAYAIALVIVGFGKISIAFDNFDEDIYDPAISVHRRPSYTMSDHSSNPRKTQEPFDYDIPIETARRNVDQLGIRYDELPHRPFWAPLVGKTEEDFKVRIAAKVMAGSILTGRALEQPEKDALAQHWAGMLVTQSWDLPVVAASTIALYRGTRAKYGFPFWTPKPDKFNPNKFLGKETPFAPSIYHSLRMIAWYTGCKLVIGIFVTSYAISVYSANYSVDPRLVRYRQDVKRKIESEAPGPKRFMQKEQQPSGLPASDDPSTTWPSTEQNAQDAPSPWPTAPRSQAESTQDSYKTDESSMFDDASPVAPDEQQRGASLQASQGGSAWDRLRRGQAPSSSAAAGQGSTQQASAWGRKREDELTSRGARDGSSFSYTSGDQEKAYAKEQAQKDFDEMLEKERRGDGSGRR